MNKKVKWGIIGVGGIAKRRTLPAMDCVPNAEIIAIMDKNVNDMIELSKKYGISDIYTSEDDLLKNPDIDAVYVASPVVYHKEQALKVLRAGKHLLLEKPLGLNKKESEEILKVSQQYNVKAGAAMIMRFHDGHQKMKELVKEGALGDIVSGRAQLTCWFPDMENNWRQSFATAGGGALMDMGIHCIDLLSYIIGDNVVKAGGIIERKTFRYEVEDSASALIKMSKGAVCYIDANYNIPDEAAKCFLEIYGTKGSILANGTIGQDGGGEIFVTLSSESQGYNSKQSRTNISNEYKLEYEHGNMYAKQITSFSECILKDTKPEVAFDEAFSIMKVIDTLYRASKEEKFLEVN